MAKFSISQRITIKSKSLGTMTGTITGVSYNHIKDTYLYSADIDVKKPSCRKIAAGVPEHLVSLA